MLKFLPLQTMKNKIKELQEHVDLVELFEPNSLEEWLIKEYAITGSLVETANRAKARGFLMNGEIIEKEHVVTVITGKASYPLHKRVKWGYQSRAKANKR